MSDRGRGQGRGRGRGRARGRSANPPTLVSPGRATSSHSSREDERVTSCEAAATGIRLESSSSRSSTSPLAGQPLQPSQPAVTHTKPATQPAKTPCTPLEVASPPAVSPGSPAAGTSARVVEKSGVSGFRPQRPGVGSVGEQIALCANRFRVSVSDRLSVIYHYDVKFSPEVTQRRIGDSVMDMWARKFGKELGGLRPVFDGKANLYTVEKLPHEEASYEVCLKTQEDKKETNITVTVKCAAALPVQKFNEALAGDVQSCPQDVIQALDIIMRKSARATLTTIGRSVFGSGPRKSLGQGLEIGTGYYQTVRPSSWRVDSNLWSVDLTVDVSATAFYKNQSVDKYLCEVMEWQESCPSLSLRKEDREKFLGEIKGVRVVATHLPYARKFTVCDVTHKSADQLSFDLDQEGGGSIKCTVAKYFQEKYKRRLKYPRLQCLQVAPKDKRRFFPMEVCEIAPNQRCLKKLPKKLEAAMIRTTVRPPAERRKQIMEFISSANFNRDPDIKQFDITVDLQMCEVNGRLLPPPQLRYKDIKNKSKLITPRDGMWNMREYKFVEGKKVTSWALLCFISSGGQGSHGGYSRQCCCCKLSSELQKASKRYAMPIDGDPAFHEHINKRQLTDVFRAMSNIELVVAILPHYDSKDIYSELKQLGDLDYEIPTQCVVERTAKESNLQVLSNLCLKINAKLGGVNVVVPEILRFKPDEAVIFFGADVTHPSPGTDETTPSIAAVVGSIDKEACKYACQVRAQKSRKEIITELQGMVTELLKEYRTRTLLLPTRIIFYRDGVSEGQFSEVHVEELQAIQRACLSLHVSYQPGITMVVVRKRHHTKFFPGDKEDKCSKSGNMPPGTVVDTVVVHPIEFDFFLYSHQGIQGTSRPTYYYVLYDDNEFTADALQMLTYQLCHVYARCTRSVSLPAPVYYAHLAAYRARCYPHSRMSGQASSSATTREQKYSTMKMMYFT